MKQMEAMALKLEKKLILLINWIGKVTKIGKSMSIQALRKEFLE
jgi:hypothetical protein